LNKQKALTELNPNTYRRIIKRRVNLTPKNNAKNTFLPNSQNSQDIPKIA